MKAGIVVLIMMFLLVVYMVVVPTTLDHLAPVMTTPEGSEFEGQTSMVQQVATVWVPLFWGIGLFIYGFAAVSKEESYAG